LVGFIKQEGFGFFGKEEVIEGGVGCKQQDREKGEDERY